MRVIQGIKNFSKSDLPRPVVVAIGTFDGVHQAHKKIIGRAVAYARRSGGTSLVLTFYPHPLSLIAPHKTPRLLTGIAHRLRLIAESGPDICLVVDFTRDFSALAAREFIDTVLIALIGADRVIVGENFAFGKDRSGNVSLLRAYAQKKCFDLDVVKPVKQGGHVVSSTLVRRMIEAGKLRMARNLLGRGFSILGTVVRGDGRGRELGFPTANIDPHQEAIPAPGVYAVKAKWKGKVFGGMVYVGKRPTFYANAEKMNVEVNIFNFKKNIYGQEIELLFLKKIRGDRKFASAGRLRSQMRRDKLRARLIIKQSAKNPIY